MELEPRVDLYVFPVNQGPIGFDRILRYDLPASETVEGVKARIAADYGIGRGRQKLKLGDGTVMEDWRGLKWYGIHAAAPPAIVLLELDYFSGFPNNEIIVRVDSAFYPYTVHVLCRRTDKVWELKEQVAGVWPRRPGEKMDLYFRGRRLAAEEEGLWQYWVVEGAVNVMYAVFSSAPKPPPAGVFCPRSRL